MKNQLGINWPNTLFFHINVGAKLCKPTAVAFATRNPDINTSAKTISLKAMIDETYTWMADEDAAPDGEIDFSTKSGFPTRSATQTDTGYATLETAFVLKYIRDHGLMDGVNGPEPPAAAAAAQ